MAYVPAPTNAVVEKTIVPVTNAVGILGVSLISLSLLKSGKWRSSEIEMYKFKYLSTLCIKIV